MEHTRKLELPLNASLEKEVHNNIFESTINK